MSFPTIVVSVAELVVTWRAVVAIARTRPIKISDGAAKGREPRLLPMKVLVSLLLGVFLLLSPAVFHAASQSHGLRTS